MFPFTVSTVRYLNVVENVLMRIAVASWCVPTEELTSTRIGVTVLYTRLFLHILVHRYVFLILFLTKVMLPRAQFCKCLLTQPYITFANSPLHDGLFNINHLPPASLYSSPFTIPVLTVVGGGGFVRVELVLVVWLPCSASS